MQIMTRKILYLGLDPTHYESQGDVTHFPAIRIVPRPVNSPDIQQALQAWGDVTHVLFTSKTAVKVFHGAFQDVLPDCPLTDKHVSAVGQVTALTLENFGCHANIIAQEETAEGLVEALSKIDLRDACVLLPRSSRGRHTLPSFLEKQGTQHLLCDLYDTVTNTQDLPPSLDTFDEIVFTSPSTVQAFTEIFGTIPTHTTLKSQGPITAAQLRQRSNAVSET